MQVILLERIVNLGQMGDEVRVRDGYARNYLLPQGRALRANEVNRKRFESQRAQLEARNLERRNEAAAVAERLDGHTFIMVRQAAETGQLYGSVTTRDLAETVSAEGFSVGRSQIVMARPIKTIGLHEVVISLHAEVAATITANVARSADEAERQARGEDLSLPADEAAEAAEADEADAEEADAESGETASDSEAEDAGIETAGTEPASDDEETKTD